MELLNRSDKESIESVARDALFFLSQPMVDDSAVFIGNGFEEMVTGALEGEWLRTNAARERESERAGARREGKEMTQYE